MRTTYFKIGLGMLLAFFVSGLVGNEVFVAYTPQVRPNLGPYLMSRITQIGPSTSYAVASLFHNLPEQKLEKLPFTKIAPGVYAKEQNHYSYTEVKAGEVELIQYTFNVNGKTIKINVPKGLSPPPQQILENIYK